MTIRNDAPKVGFTDPDADHPYEENELTPREARRLLITLARRGVLDKVDPKILAKLHRRSYEDYEGESAP
jgi:hypothetical protein